MAKQTEIAYEPTKEWQDFQTGGTRIDAADLNNMEGGIADACAAVDELRTKRLPTYLVAQDGDTATQDLYLETILGPCLILDLAERATYYDNGEDGEGHERTLITSGADINALRDSLSRTVTLDPPVSLATVGQIDQDSPQLVSIRVAGDLGDVSLIATRNGIGLWSGDEETMIGRLSWET